MSDAVADVLERAADLIEPEGRWTQGVLAKSAGGVPVAPEHDCAVCWCASGAIIRISGDRLPKAAWYALKCIIGLGEIIPSWNDAPERTQSEVVAKLREAAKLARETVA